MGYVLQSQRAKNAPLEHFLYALSSPVLYKDERKRKRAAFATLFLLAPPTVVDKGLKSCRGQYGVLPWVTFCNPNGLKMLHWSIFFTPFRAQLAK